MFITASGDFTAKLIDTKTFKVLKVFETERPVNSAAISPLLEHVMLGGGQDANAVTTTSSKTGKFEVRFFRMIYQEEFGRVKGHFGPIHTVVFSPDGHSFVSGAEVKAVFIFHCVPPFPPNVIYNSIHPLCVSSAFNNVKRERLLLR